MTTAIPAFEVVLLVRGRATRTWLPDDGVVTVGSGAGMTIRGRRDVIAEHHATIYVERDRVLAVAEGDAELLHNGESVSIAAVEADDILTVGPFTLQIRMPGPRRTPPRPAPRHDPVRIGVRLPDGRSRTIDLRDGRFVIGATQGNLRVPGLADPHAELVIDGSRVEVTALDGPLHVGDRPIAAVALRSGVVARLGPLELWLDAEDEDPPTVHISADDPTATFPDGDATERTETVGRVRRKHPDDEDYDEEIDFVTPFDLAGSLRAVSARPDERGGSCVASAVLLEADRVRDLGVVEAGEERELSGGPRCACEGSHVRVIWPDHALGFGGVPPTEGLVVLRRGQSTLATIGPRTWRISAIRPPRRPVIPNLLRTMGTAALIGLSTAVSMGVHGVLGLGVGTLSVIDPADIVEESHEEQFAEVQLAQEPPEVRQRHETLQLSEKAPAVTSQEVTRASQMPRSENTSVSSLLSRLAATEGGASGLEDAISNIDAIAAGPGSDTAFDLAGRLSASSGVKVARSGTGAVSTAGQVGDGVGQLAAGERRGVRGKVTKLSSRMKVQGTLDPAEVTRVVNGHMGAIQACYEREMTKQPGLAGRIQFEWTIATSGAVRGVRVQSSTMPSDVVANCISAEIKSWRFASPTGGDAVISYPFAFRSG